MLSQLIEQTYFRGLVFNQSWEDPVLDYEALNVVPDRDCVLTITSGGCNSLNLLCLRPRRLVCVDANPAQTHLLELKLAGIRHLHHDDFFTLFGSQEGTAAAAIYRKALRHRLACDTRAYWDANVGMLERGVLSQGKLGLFLRWLRRYLRWQLGQQRIRYFFCLDDLDRQRDYYYREIQPRLWRGSALRILCSRPVLALAGMHPSQYDLIASRNGIENYIRERIEYVLTSVPIRDNYFAAQAVLGAYVDRERLPPYLLEENFTALQQTVDRVTTVTGWLTDYLELLAEGSIDKFSLLDILDWMDPAIRLAMLRAVIRAGADRGRFVYRSTISSLPVPAELEASVVSEADVAGRLFAKDRSAVYSSFYVYRIDKGAGAT